MTDETETKTETTEAPRGDETPRGEQAPAVAKPLILGRKIGMLQHFRPDGSAVAATVIAAEPNIVTAVRTKERDGYSGLQLGYGTVDKKKLQKARLGHLKESGATVQHLRVLQDSALVRSEKVGRVRTCQIDPAGLRNAEAWLQRQRTTWEHRLDRLGAVLDDRTKE